MTHYVVGHIIFLLPRSPLSSTRRGGGHIPTFALLDVPVLRSTVKWRSCVGAHSAQVSAPPLGAGPCSPWEGDLSSACPDTVLCLHFGAATLLRMRDHGLMTWPSTSRSWGRQRCTSAPEAPLTPYIATAISAYYSCCGSGLSGDTYGYRQVTYTFTGDMACFYPIAIY